MARTPSRRSVLKAGLALGAAAAAGALPFGAGDAEADALRSPGSVPYPLRPVGVKTNVLPFDHLVIVMQENHSFDNYLGMLPLRGQPLADGFTFDSNGLPTNSNPLGSGRMHAYREQSMAGSTNEGSQTWN